MQKLFLLLLLLFQVANYEEALLQISFLATTTTDQIPQNPSRIPPTKNTQSPPIIHGIRRTQQPTKKLLQEKTQPKFNGRKIQPNNFLGKKTHPLTN
jgi:hypothetical protein